MSVQYWNSLAEAQKLTQSVLIPKVVEQEIKRDNLVDRMPTALARGLKVEWLREKTTMESSVARFSVGDTTVWKSGMTYDKMETELKRCYLAVLLNQFIPSVYGTVNNYETIQLMECRKGVYLFLGDRVIYDDITYGGDAQVDGIHALAAVQTGTNLDQDNGEVGLSLFKVRKMLDAMKQGCDIIYTPSIIGLHWDAAYEEAGWAGLATASAGQFSFLTRSFDAAGKPIYAFAGIPITRSDYLVAENANSGIGTSVRAKHNTGSANYSLFGIKFGNAFKYQPGLMMCYGNSEMQSKLSKTIYHKNMQNYVDTSGLEFVTYFSPLLSSKLCLGRIYDITDAAITV